MNHIGFKDIHPQEPNLAQMAVNLIKEVPKMIQSKLRFVPQDVFESRMGLCRTCFYWKEDGNLGLGKCTHEKCGCSMGKMKLIYSKCPIGNWGAHE